MTPYAGIKMEKENLLERAGVAKSPHKRVSNSAQTVVWVSSANSKGKGDHPEDGPHHNLWRPQLLPLTTDSDACYKPT